MAIALQFRSRLWGRYQNTPHGQVLTSHWETEATDFGDAFDICRQITAQLVGPSPWSNFLCRLNSVGHAYYRWQIGLVGHGFLIDQRLSPTDFHGIRPYIFSKGFLAEFVAAKVNWHTSGNRLHYTQLSQRFQDDFTEDRIWFAIRTQIQIWAQSNLSLRTLANGSPFYFVNRSTGNVFRKPNTFSVDDRPSRQLHRREEV